MILHQLPLNLNPPRVVLVAADSSCSGKFADSDGFNFGGRIDKGSNRRVGQFQYRFGRKVQPPDERFDKMYKLGNYD